MPDTHPTHRLLVDLVGARPEDVTALLATRREKGGDVDWPALLATAKDHAVLPLLQRALSAAEGASVPTAAAAKLRSRVVLESGRSLRFAMELVRILDRFTEAAIAAIPIKGPTLAADVYGNLALRPFGDLDVLIRTEDSAAAHQVLTAAGYRPFEAFPTEIHFVHDELMLCLDLHLAASHHEVPFDPPFDRLYERLRTVDLVGHRVPVLAPEDTLLLLCAQLVKDLYGQRIRYSGRVRLVKVIDIATLLRGWSPDWTGLFARADEFRATRLLLAALAFVERLVALPLPTSVRARCRRTPLLRSFPGSAWDYIFGPLPPRFSRLERIDFQLRVRDRLRDRFEIAFRPNDLDQSAFPLPQRLRFLHHVTRPLRIGIAYGRDLLAGLRDPASGR